MPERVTIFINEHPVEVEPGSSILEAVGVWDADLGRRLEDGTAYVTDAVGRVVGEQERVGVGTIVRVIRATRGKRQ